MELEIGGGGKKGADGLALWYVDTPRMEGPVFGSKDYWNGIGIFFDTFDNDNNVRTLRFFLFYSKQQQFPHVKCLPFLFLSLLRACSIEWQPNGCVGVQ